MVPLQIRRALAGEAVMPRVGTAVPAVKPDQHECDAGDLEPVSIGAASVDGVAPRC